MYFKSKISDLNRICSFNLLQIVPVYFEVRSKESEFETNIETDLNLIFAKIRALTKDQKYLFLILKVCVNIT